MHNEILSRIVVPVFLFMLLEKHPQEYDESFKGENTILKKDMKENLQNCDYCAKRKGGMLYPIKMEL